MNIIKQNDIYMCFNIENSQSTNSIFTETILKTVFGMKLECVKSYGIKIEKDK